MKPLSVLLKEAKYVQIELTNKGKVLKHFFVRDKKWGLPAGAIEKGESPREAAARELLERTGYKPKLNNLVEIDSNKQGFKTFRVDKKHTKKVGKPGEYGGYATKTKWAKF